MRFSDLLLAVNTPALNDFQRWVFEPGMLFNAPNKWWGDLGLRAFPHEGVDFCLYENHSGMIAEIGHHALIPAIHDGVVKHIFSDYLGQAIVVEHKMTHFRSDMLISVYAHTRPLKQIRAGVVVKQGDIIATVADTGRAKTPIRPHLHYSVGQPSAVIDYLHFVWNTMRNPDMVVLLNPLDAIDDAYLTKENADGSEHEKDRRR